MASGTACSDVIDDGSRPPRYETDVRLAVRARRERPAQIIGTGRGPSDYERCARRDPTGEPVKDLSPRHAAIERLVGKFELHFVLAQAAGGEESDAADGERCVAVRVLTNDGRRAEHRRMSAGWHFAGSLS